jgi:hypothetical protein
VGRRRPAAAVAELGKRARTCARRAGRSRAARALTLRRQVTEETRPTRLSYIPSASCTSARYTSILPCEFGRWNRCRGEFW